MGHRANLVIVDESGERLYYSHWGANSLDSVMFWGPEQAEAYIKSQQPTTEWRNELWAEGGVVLDQNRKVFLMYGGGWVDSDVPLLRLYLGLMQQVWKDWTIRWAYDGVLDIADYVGIPRSVVEYPGYRTPPKREFSPSWLFTREDVDSIASICLPNGSIRLYPIPFADSDWLKHGPILVEAMQQQTGMSEWHQPKEKFLYDGIHVDVNAKKLSIWSAHAPGIVDHINTFWPGWEIDWLHDRFEAHVALTENRLVLEMPSISDLLAQLETNLMRDPFNGVTYLQSRVEEMMEDGHQVGINLDALLDTPQNLDADFKRKTFDAAVEAWKQTKKDD